MAQYGLPTGWEVRTSKSRNLPYYFNVSTKESRWEPPAGSDSDALSRYMAEYHSSAAPTNGVRPDDHSDSGKIRAAHLLVKHNASRRPASWRQAQITRSKDEAMAMIRDHQKRIQQGEVKLGDLAVTESDCPSARKKGDLGYFKKGDMQKPFEEAVFALQPGQMSDVVTTDSGLHLIERLE